MQLWCLKEKLGFHRGRAGPAGEQWSLYRDRSQVEEQVAWCWLTIKYRWRGGRQNGWDDLPIHMGPVMKSRLWLPQSFQLWSGEMEISSAWWPVLPASGSWDENGSLLFFTILSYNPPSLQIFLSWIITYSNKFKTEGSTGFLPGIWRIKKKIELGKWALTVLVAEL